MGYLQETDPGGTSPISVSFEKAFGFLPNLFRAQALLPRIPEALAGLADAVVLQERTLSRIRKEFVMVRVATAYQNEYCVTLHHHTLHALGMPDSELDQFIVDHHQAGLSRPDTALIDFALKLATRAAWLSAEDIAAVREYGFGYESILETIVVTALANFLCTLSAGLGPAPDFEPPAIPGAGVASIADSGSCIGGTRGPRGAGP